MAPFLKIWLLLRIWFDLSEIVGGTIKGYDLPILPANFPQESPVNSTYGKLIPRIIWIAVKDRNDPYPTHLDHFFNRNPQWEKRFCDNECKEDFMKKVCPMQSVTRVS